MAIKPFNIRECLICLTNLQRIDFIEAYIKGGKIFVKTKNNAFNSSKIDLEEAV